MSATAEDSDGKVVYVYLTLNNQPVSVDTEAPYEWALDKMLLKGLNRIRAVAFDDHGNLAFDTVYVMNRSDSDWPRFTVDGYANFSKK